MNRERRINSPRDRERYLEDLGNAAIRCNSDVLGYCAMSTHSHVLGPGDARRLGGMIHRANSNYGAWWNRTHAGFGRVFAERPKSIVVSSDEQLARVVAYMHNNPVRAGLVTCPADSDWSSHRMFIGETSPPEWLHVEWVLAEIGFSSTPSGRAAFHDFVVSRATLPRDPTLSGPGPVPPDACVHLIEIVARRMGVDPATLVRPGRDDHANEARRSLLTVASSMFGIPASQIAKATGLSRAMISKVARDITEMQPIPRAAVESIVEEYLHVSALRNGGLGELEHLSP